MDIQQMLFSMQDLAYRDFAAKLMPTVDASTVIGVRTPHLRNLARELAKSPTIDRFFHDLPHQYYEENNLHAYLLCQMRDFDACILAIDRFLPYINNWATCDGLRPKCFSKKPDLLLKKIREWMASDHPYTVRFGIEMLMCHFLGSRFCTEYLDWTAAIDSEEYYVKMMVAWFFATALTKQWDAAIPYLEQRKLSAWIHQKAIQKAIESHCISDDHKKYLKALKIQ